MLAVWVDIMLWDGVALLGFIGIISLGIVRYGSMKATILPAACIPVASGILELGYYLFWWDHRGFINFTLTYAMAAAIVAMMLFLPGGRPHDTTEAK